MTTASNHTKHLAGLARRGMTRWLTRRARTAVALATLLAIVAPASGPPGVTRAQALASAPLTGASNPLCFNPPVTTSSVGTAPVSIAVIDWNGDGKFESLAVANQGSNLGVILLNSLNGDGTFPTYIPVEVGPSPSSIVVGELGGDGNPDLAVANHISNIVSIFVSNAFRSFPPAGTPISVGLNPVSIVVGDWNGDGRSDLAVANQGSNNVSIIISNASGGLVPLPPISVGSGPTSIVVGDWNGDGRSDLAVANRLSNNVSILLGDGFGLFQDAGSIGSLFGPSSIAASDVNGDGKLDLAVANQGSNNVAILLGNGDDTFQPARFFGVGTNAYPTSIAVADLNRDGKSDLAVANHLSNNVAILLGNGDSTFQPAQFFAAGTGPTSIAVGNWNGGNGGVYPDLAVANSGSNNVFTWLSCPAPAISLNPTSLNFGDQPVGTSSGPQYVTLSNVGDASLTISNVTISGDFAQNNGCGGSLAAGASCVFHVTFTPTATGSRTGTLTINDNAPGSPHTVALSGTGRGPGVSLSPTSLDFGNQLVDTASATQIITLVNSGNDLLTISSIAASGDFSGDLESDPFCDPLLGILPGDSCLIDVTFTPTATGSRSGTLTINDNAPGSPHTVALNGMGTAPAVSLSPQSLDFGNQQVGTSATQSVILSNSGSAPVTISSIAANGDFAQTNNCGGNVAPGASCAINVTFTPTAAGSRSGTLTIADNATGGPHTVPLSGTGTAPADTTPPTITISAPANTTYTLNQVVAASYSCADESGGSVLASCLGSVPNDSNIDTASIGAKTFTVHAADNAGNAASASVAYSVIYTFRGFFQPVDNLPVLNAVKAGSAIPVKFSLAGDQGLTILAAGYPKWPPIACDSAAPIDDIEQTVTAGSSSLTYDAANDQYVYVWKTDKAWAGSCRQLIVRLADGTDHRADFAFK